MKELDNKTIKLIKSLKMAKYRKETGLYVVEGKRIVEEAIKYGKPEYIVCSKDFAETDKSFKNAFVLENKVFNSLCDTKTPQGVLAVMKMHNDNAKINQGVVVALENVQDPLNVGTIIRTADAFGASAVVLSKGCADIYSPKAARGTMGSLFHLPIIKADDFTNRLKAFKENGFCLVAGDLNGSEKAPLKCDKCVIIIGNEGGGISLETKRMCDFLWKIKMQGKAESLNASVAAGIMLYTLAN